MTQLHLKHILWAVDPFWEDEALQSLTVSTLKALAANATIAIEPVSIFPLEGALKQPHALSQQKDRILVWLNQCKVPGLKAPVFLTQDDLSLRNAVHNLFQHASNTKADMIVVSSQARKGSTRFLIGSFAESLILESALPTLIVSPRCQPLQQIETLLFPTDFSQRSLGSFPQVVQLAKQLGSTLTLFHQIEVLSGKGPQFQTEKMKRETRTLAAICNQAGVKSEVIVHDGPATVSEAILKETSIKKSAVIAMVSHTGAGLMPVRLGSNTRQIIRAANCPIWVIHPTEMKPIH